MQRELAHQLGHEKHSPAGRGTSNSRNGTTSKTVKGDFGETVAETPRSRQGTFETADPEEEPSRFNGFDGQTLSMYARRMTVREIQGRLKEI